MLEILKAIVKKGESTPALTASLAGEFWTRHAPPEVEFPYMVIEPDGGSPDYDTSTRYTQPITLRFVFIGKYLADLVPAVKAWRDAFNFQTLTLDRGRVLQGELKADNFVDEAPPQDESANCHHVLEFEFLQQQSHQ